MGYIAPYATCAKSVVIVQVQLAIRCSLRVVCCLARSGQFPNLHRPTSIQPRTCPFSEGLIPLIQLYFKSRQVISLWFHSQESVNEVEVVDEGACSLSVEEISQKDSSENPPADLRASSAQSDSRPQSNSTCRDRPLSSCSKGRHISGSSAQERPGSGCSSQGVDTVQTTLNGTGHQSGINLRAMCLSRSPISVLFSTLIQEGEIREKLCSAVLSYRDIYI